MDSYSLSTCLEYFNVVPQLWVEKKFINIFFPNFKFRVCITFQLYHVRDTISYYHTDIKEHTSVAIGWFLQPIRRRGLSGFPRCFQGVWLGDKSSAGDNLCAASFPHCRCPTRKSSTSWGLWGIPSSLLPASKSYEMFQAKEPLRFSANPYHEWMWADAHSICVQSLTLLASVWANQQHPQRGLDAEREEIGRGHTLSGECRCPVHACHCTCDFPGQGPIMLTSSHAVDYAEESPPHV